MVIIAGSRFFLLSALYIRWTTCGPTVSLSIASQIPPLAHAGYDFSFEFADSTFGSVLPLTYSLSSSVPWLHLDPIARKIYGYVPTTFHGSFDANITASDLEGGVTEHAVFLAEKEAPLQTAQFSEDELDFPDVPGNGKGGFLLYYSQAFNLSMPKRIISAGEHVARYYAMSGDNTPLPNWLQFDQSNGDGEESLYLSGVAPPPYSPVTPPQSFPIRIVASTRPGYSSSDIEFSLVVGARKFYFERTETDVDVSGNSRVDFQAPGLFLGEAAAPYGSSLLQSIDFQGPQWMSFDESTGKLTGKMPRRFDGSHVECTLTATDIYGDTASSKIRSSVASSIRNLAIGQEDLFTVQSIPSVNTTAGAVFNYRLNPSIFKYYNLDIEVSLSPPNTSNWLSVDESRLLLSGNIPESFQNTIVTVNVSASLEDESTRSTRIFHINIIPDSKSTTTTATPSPTPAHNDSSGFSTKQRNVLLISIFSILFLIILCLCYIYMYLHRRRLRRKICAMSCICAGSPIPPDDGDDGQQATKSRPVTSRADVPSWVSYPSPPPHDRGVQKSSVFTSAMPVFTASSVKNSDEHEERHGIPRKDSQVLPHVQVDDHNYDYHQHPKDETDDDTSTYAMTPSSKCTTPSPSPNLQGLSPFPSTRQRQFMPRDLTPRGKHIKKDLLWPDFGKEKTYAGSNADTVGGGSSLGNRTSIRLVAEPSFNSIRDRLAGRQPQQQKVRTIRRVSSTENWVVVDDSSPSVQQRKKKPYIIRPDADSSSLGEESSSSDDVSSAVTYSNSDDANNDAGSSTNNLSTTVNFQYYWHNFTSGNVVDPESAEQLRNRNHNNSKSTLSSSAEDFEEQRRYVTQRRRSKQSRGKFKPLPEIPHVSGSVGCSGAFNFDFIKESSSEADITTTEEDGDNDDRAGAIDSDCINDDEEEEELDCESISDGAQTAKLVEFARGKQLATTVSQISHLKSLKGRILTPEDQEQSSSSSDDNERALI